MILNNALTGGDPRSLGKTEEVVAHVLKNKNKLVELFACIESSDEVVRMRASDALEKICKQKPSWFISYKHELLNKWPSIHQASVQWHLAQMLSEISLTESETQRAIMILKKNLETTSDWIVENLALESLAEFTRRGLFDTNELIDILNLHAKSNHKSVVSRVNKLLAEFKGVK